MNAVLSFLNHPLAERLGWTMLHFLWQGAALAQGVTPLLLAWDVFSPRPPVRKVYLARPEPNS